MGNMEKAEKGEEAQESLTVCINPKLYSSNRAKGRSKGGFYINFIDDVWRGSLAGCFGTFFSGVFVYIPF